MNRVYKTRSGSSFVGFRESVTSSRLGPDLSKPSWFCDGTFVLKSCIRVSVSGFVNGGCDFLPPAAGERTYPSLRGIFLR